jgi:hypothetical protein
LASGNLKWSEATAKGIRSQVVQEEYHIEEAEEPETSTGSGTVHYVVSEALGIPNLTFSKVLMLVMRLTLEVLDAIETEKIEKISTTLGLGIVGCTMLANDIFVRDQPDHKVRLISLW